MLSHRTNKLTCQLAFRARRIRDLLRLFCFFSVRQFNDSDQSAPAWLVNGLWFQVGLHLQRCLFIKGNMKGASETEIEGENQQ